MDLEKLQEEKRRHFETAERDTWSPLEGRVYRGGWPSGYYVLHGHYPCGYHLEPVELKGVAAPAEWACISERAIDRTYHEQHNLEVPPRLEPGLYAMERPGTPELGWEVCRATKGQGPTRRWCLSPWGACHTQGHVWLPFNPFTQPGLMAGPVEDAQQQVEKWTQESKRDGT